jgi:hypothetical protein
MSAAYFQAVLGAIIPLLTGGGLVWVGYVLGRRSKP